MVNPKILREDADLLRRSLIRRGDKTDLDRIIDIDNKRRNLITHVQELKKQRNDISENVGKLRKQGKNAEKLMAQAKVLAQNIRDEEQQLAAVEKEYEQLLLWIPNIPHESVPDGQSSEYNKFMRGLKNSPVAEFDVLDHEEIGAALDILDLKRAAKISGSRFILFKGAGARLERALINFFVDVHTNQHGYVEIAPPVLNTKACLFGTGQLPKLAEDTYKCENNDLYLCPTAEVPLTNLHGNEIIPEKNLPIKYVAYTPCFRREAGSYGKDVKGIKRVHQFDKVELVKYATPDTGYDEFEKMLSDAETIVKMLDLPYRIMLLCTGDMTFASAKTYDIEVYALGAKEWLEVSSVSIYEQFQARRANIRFRSKEGGVDYVYTMNGSGLALPRIFIAILENHQTKDGRIRVPDVLRPYMNGEEYL